MTRTARNILGICTPLPLLCIAAFYLNYLFTLVVYMPANVSRWAGDPNHVAFIHDMMKEVLSPIMIACLAIAIGGYIGLLIFYIKHIITNKPKAEWEMVMWILLFIFFGSIAELIYFFLRITPKKETTQ
jgi:hypothetical protein